MWVRAPTIVPARVDGLVGLDLGPCGEHDLVAIIGTVDELDEALGFAMGQGLANDTLEPVVDDPVAGYEVFDESCCLHTDKGKPNCSDPAG